MHPPRFLVDSTAVRLSRWLRFMGLDVSLDSSESVARLLLRARREGRVLLTRRRELAGAREAVLLTSDHLDEQLRQVGTAYKLAVESASRCTVCNAELVVVPRVNADGRVPEFIYQSHRKFAFCKRCDRYYWKGTHWKNVRDASARMSDTDR
ncbi:MAG: hypothetical protein JSW03_05595 [Candidatus Eiseniibacteriota bacterium]|nr:MAG: hypothetical protein JSW03_05595 [Candidatus Eisenbacteria bacterium]